MKSYTYLFAIFILLFVACKNNESQESTDIVYQAEQEYIANPNKESAAKYIAAITKYNIEHPNHQQLKLYMEKAIDAARKEELKVAEVGFLSSYIKRYGNTANLEKTGLRLTRLMKELGRKNAYVSMVAAYYYKFPNNDEAKYMKDELNLNLSNPKDYMIEMGKRLFPEDNPTSIDKNAAIRYVDANEAFVMMNPNYTEAPIFLTRSAEVAKAAGTYKKAIELYDWIIYQYPNSDRAPLALFMKALMLEDNMNQLEEARKNYELFLEKYPDHSFADDAKFSLENLGKTNEEIEQYLKNVREEALQ